MFIRLVILTVFCGFAISSATATSAQTVEVKGSINPRSNQDDEDRPKSFKETLEKMRIQKEKKDYAEMLDRGREALKLSEELENTYTNTGRLDSSDMSKLVEVEKLVKKIRSELGGGDDDGDDEVKETARPAGQGDVIKSFRKTTGKLIEELKKTTRFTVSAAAIQTSNAVLKLAKLLRISR